ncbi:MAG: hypothetical protein ABIQ39_02015 [Ilumatobacteraceae bacterium]
MRIRPSAVVTDSSVDDPTGATAAFADDSGATVPDAEFDVGATVPGEGTEVVTDAAVVSATDPPPPTPVVEPVETPAEPQPASAHTASAAGNDFSSKLRDDMSGIFSRRCDDPMNTYRPLSSPSATKCRGPHLRARPSS